jgi:hypothetical protein
VACVAGETCVVVLFATAAALVFSTPEIDRGASGAWKSRPLAWVVWLGWLAVLSCSLFAAVLDDTLALAGATCAAVVAILDDTGT